MQNITLNWRDFAYYLAIAGVFVAMKFIYSGLSTDELRFFLLPLDRLVGLITGSTSVYIAGQGFYHPSFDILIDKSCSGFNFFALCFIMLGFLSVRYFKHTRHRIIAILAFFFLACILVTFVNGARILTSIFTGAMSATSAYRQDALMHEAEGAFIYLFFLIMIYTLFNFILMKKDKVHA